MTAVTVPAKGATSVVSFRVLWSWVTVSCAEVIWASSCKRVAGLT